MNRAVAQPVRSVIVVAGTAMALLVVAILNRFPLIFSDTGAYVRIAETGFFPLDRPIFYGLFLQACRSVQPSLWSIVIAQSLLAASLLWIVVSTELGDCTRKGLRFAAIVGILTVGTSLPWFTGFVMPDIFAGTLFLSLYALAFLWNRIGWFRRLVVATGFVLSNMVHLSHMAMAGLLLPALLVTAARNRQQRMGVGTACALFVAVVVAIPITNQVYSGEPRLSPQGSSNFLVARLIENGLLTRLLQDHCENDYVLCAHRERVRGMSAERYLWSKQTPLHEIGGWKEVGPENRRMILDSIRFYPLPHLNSIALGTTRQLFRFGLDDQARKIRFHWMAARELRERYPSELESFRRSRQQRGQLRSLARIASSSQLLLLLVGNVAFLTMWARRRGMPAFAQSFRHPLLASTLAFLIVNALICGALAGVYDRYQARVVWLLPFALMVAAISAQKTVGPARGSFADESAEGC